MCEQIRNRILSHNPSMCSDDAIRRSVSFSHSQKDSPLVTYAESMSFRDIRSFAISTTDRSNSLDERDAGQHFTHNFVYGVIDSALLASDATHIINSTARATPARKGRKLDMPLGRGGARMVLVLRFLLIHVVRLFCKHDLRQKRILTMLLRSFR